MQESNSVSFSSKPVYHTLQEIQQLSLAFINGSDLSDLLSSSQILQLESLSNHYFGTECLLKSWLLQPQNPPEGTYCQPAWDNIYCWPASPAGTKSVITCEEAFQQRNAFRVCSENGKWLWGNWTNYTECADSFEEIVRENQEERELVGLTQNVIFFGSILSLCFLLSAVVIFLYFKSLWCDRVTVHIHLMVALIFRYILLFIITEPFVLNRETTYRSVDLICKLVVSFYLFATMTSINWMFIEGIYINGKLTTSVFDRRAPFKLYYSIGWLFPVVAIIAYVCVMEVKHPVKCWKGYSDMDELWILLAPMLVALLTNFLLLVNILRVLLQAVQNRGGAQASELAQFRRAAKATAFLIPLLGVNNLLFVYNPGGSFHKYYVILNAVFGSTQGIVVSVVYCFMSNDVRDTFRRAYSRYKSRQSTRRRTPLRVAWSRRGDSGRTWDSMTTTDESLTNSPGRFRSIRSSRWIKRSSERMVFKQTCRLDSVAVVEQESGRETCQIYLAEEMQLGV